MMANYRRGLEMNEIMCGDRWLQIITGSNEKKNKNAITVAVITMVNMKLTEKVLKW